MSGQVARLRPLEHGLKRKCRPAPPDLPAEPQRSRRHQRCHRPPQLCRPGEPRYETQCDYPPDRCARQVRQSVSPASSTTLENSTSKPSPVVLTMRPRFSLILGSITFARIDLSRLRVPSSSSPISREYPDTSAARIAARRRVWLIWSRQ